MYIIKTVLCLTSADTKYILSKKKKLMLADSLNVETILVYRVVNLLKS